MRIDGFNPEGGTKNYSFSTYDSHSELYEAMRLSRGIHKPGWGYFLRAESFYNVASAEEEYSRELGAPPSMRYHAKSYGESFLAMAQSNFKSNGVYLLDEPEAALSPQRQLMSHAMYYKMLRAVRSKEIPFHFLHVQNVNQVIENIHSVVKAEVEQKP